MSYRRSRPTLSDMFAAMTRWERACYLIAIVNFAAFIIVAVWAGGDAINGFSAGGRYYVMHHGAYTRVSRTFFHYSYVHALSQLLSFPLAIIAGARAQARARRFVERD